MKLLFLLALILSGSSCARSHIVHVESTNPNVTVVVINGQKIKCPCGEEPQQVWIVDGKINARCEACMNGEIAYLFNIDVDPDQCNVDYMRYMALVGE